MRQLGGFFCKVESSAEISSEKLHFAIQVALQDTFAVLVCKLAMNVNRGLASDRGDIAGPLATLLETAHGTVEDDQVRYSVSIVFALAVHVLEPALLFKLLDQVFVKRNLEFRRQLDLVGLNHESLNRLAQEWWCAPLGRQGPS